MSEFPPCEECGDPEGPDHRCPIYYTRPGLTLNAMIPKFTAAEAAIRDALAPLGFRFVRSVMPHDRIGLVVEICPNLDDFGPPERHDKRTEAGTV